MQSTGLHTIFLEEGNGGALPESRLSKGREAFYTRACKMKSECKGIHI